MIEFLNQVKHCHHSSSMGIWTKIGAPFFVDGARLENAGKIFIGDANGRVGFAVFQQYIIARTLLLDQ